MKYNPLTNILYKDDGLFIKKLHCPLSKQWQELSPTLDLKGKACDQCQKTVFDTAHFDDKQLVHLIKEQPQTCLKVDLNQINLTITYQNHE